MDLKTGRLEILGDGAARAVGSIKDGETISVDYTPVAYADGSHVLVTQARQVTGALRIVEDAAAGEGRDFYARFCNVSAAGGIDLLNGRQSEQQIQLAVEAQEPDGDWPIVAITRRAPGRQD